MVLEEALRYRIAGFFRGHLFSRISRISASRENIFREILGATPSSSAKTTHAHAYIMGVVWFWPNRENIFREIRSR